MVSSINLFIEKITSKNKLVLIFLFCVTLFAYGNILFGDFVFDDNTFIENNTQIRSLSNVNVIYSSSTTAGAGLVNDNFYRPNQQFIYAVIYSIFGLSPFVFHLVPILFHILNGFLLFVLFYKLGISRRSSLFGSLLFLLHPILTEAVSYISGLSEPLVTTSILSSILIFLTMLQSEKEADPNHKFLKSLLFGAVVFTIGLFSKENQLISIPLMFLIFVYEYKKGTALKFFRVFVFLGVLSILASLYIYSRLTILNFTGIIGLTGEMSIYSEHLYIRLFTFIHILPEYMKMIVFPWYLNYEKPYTAFLTLLSVQSIIISVSVIILAIITIIIAIMKKNLPTLLNISLGLSWFIMALLPVSGIIPINAIYLEHFLYVPIIGIVFFLCTFMDRIQNSNHYKILLYALMIILALFIFRIMLRNMEWGDPVKFYENEIKYEKRYHLQSARIYNNLAMEQADRGDCAKAIPNYQKAISLNDTYPQTHHNLARCFESTGQIKEAADEYFKALYIQPNFLYSLDAISKLLAAVGDKRSVKFSQLEEKASNGEAISERDLIEAAK